ncbi:MAG: sugar kinase [Lentisphaerae bacterium]|jgi:2-dehydro-3-deoxygluconokinase|nr:sugar kinase [Lentisphaerota bacterium]MBT5610760.1 sugar kinase [Lentisphaerota bacterium]MBT7060842.1 sugar kinase [Lentisphaerota bacterium]MBT7841269.1 sugar kinase [Lentisphaerota bacterium]
MKQRVVAFGEVMGRLNPSGFNRITQVLPGTIQFTFGGGEANVSVSLANLGLDAAYVTALPKHAAADACVMNLRAMGVDTSAIVRTDDGRLGLYFVETGANQRPSNVIYDRAGSSVSITPSSAYDWPGIFTGATWFHITGITPAISESTAVAALDSVKAAKAAGLTVSCDLNYRKKLWKWRPGTDQRDLAEEVMRQLVPYVDVVVGNEEDAEKVLSIKAKGTDVDSGQLNVDAYQDVAKQIVAQFPNVSKVAITLRESLSATHNNWGAMLYVAADDAAHFAPLDASGIYTPYEIRSIVDRVGGGDSFCAGLIFALLTPELSAPADAIRFAVAASCLKHSITGDFNHITRPEVDALMGGAVSGRVNR